MAAETDPESTGEDIGALVAAVSAAVPSASTDEAAAIAVALSAHMTDQQRAAAAAAEDGDVTTPWAGREWVYSGRVSQTLRRNFVRVPDTAPDDEWTAAGRVDRM